ncbi:HNH endonuclease signature motif containing protein [Snodgrassella sp. ESL0253]|uniref:HNH endonuclease n=1 Tax=Snodgrassella sp. ESL0253 TaxID=2705031 RepID=UPI00158386F0|nr:HNH endonuclease signature motif containing protein [Snodgrassella sp. ESL0253]NUE65768.1 HNH endonuclease [Snodgrassella sp. ESL0253]
MITLAQGTILNNKQMCELFLCSPQGGMRKSNKTNTLVLITNHLDSVYNDVWEDDILHYTGMGQLGNQSLEFAQNKTLANIENNGVQVHYFEVLKEHEYTYIGEMLKAGEPYIAQQLDVSNQWRQVYIFPLRLKQGGLPVEMINHHESDKLSALKRLSDKRLVAKIQQQTLEFKQANKITVKTPRYRRSMELVEYVKRQAQGYCDLCEQPAPFANKDQQPYLECHHVIWLSQNGADSLDNIVALCPNCHRKMHIVQDENDIKKLTAIARNRQHLLDTNF